MTGPRYTIRYDEKSNKPYHVFDTELQTVVSRHTWKRFAVEAIEKLIGFVA